MGGRVVPPTILTDDEFDAGKTICVVSVIVRVCVCVFLFFFGGGGGPQSVYSNNILAQRLSYSTIDSNSSKKYRKSRNFRVK